MMRRKHHLRKSSGLGISNRSLREQNFAQRASSISTVAIYVSLWRHLQPIPQLTRETQQFFQLSPTQNNEFLWLVSIEMMMQLVQFLGNQIETANKMIVSSGKLTYIRNESFP
jgi:hypothetical protein